MTLLLLAALASAQDDPAPDVVNPFEEADESDLFRLDEQLVTVASRYAQTARKAPSIVTVVTAEEIRDRGYRNIADLLRALPGFYVWKSAEGRDLAAIRGVISADNSKLLVLVDGQPWYDGVYTHSFLGDYLPIAHVQQVEVIKGPGSAIYGTNAFAGVVNIVTWEASRLDGGRVHWMAGATGRSDLTATVGGRAELAGQPVRATAYARVLGQIGDGLDVVPDGRRDIRGEDPKRGVAVGGRFASGGLQVQLHHVDYQHTFLPQEADDPNDILSKSLDTFALSFRDTFLHARWALDLRDGLTVAPYGWSQHHDNPSNYFYDTGTSVTEVGPGVFEAASGLVTVEAEKRTHRWGAGLDLEARPGIDHVLVAGAGVENVGVLSLYDAAYVGGSHDGEVTGFAALDDCGQPVGFPGNRRDCGAPAVRNLFGYAQYTWVALPSVELTGGARVDKRVPSNEGEAPEDGAFALSVSPRVGVLLVPSDSVTTKLLYGRAFRAPSVREILVRAEPEEDGTYEFASGNLDLVPETIHTGEGEVTARLSPEVSVRLDGSFSQLQNEIDKVNPPNQYCNLPGVLNIVGAELGAEASPGPLRLGASYALTLARYAGADAVDASACPGAGGLRAWTGRRQYEFPPHMVKADVGWALGDDLSVTLLGEAYSRRPRRDWGPRGLDDGAPFALLHLAGRMGEVGPDDRLSFGVTVRNLFDAAHDTGVYRDDAAEAEDDGSPSNPVPVEGEGRSLLVWLEVLL